MMYHPTQPEVVKALFEISHRRRERLRRLFFDSLGVVLLVAVFTVDWWAR